MRARDRLQVCNLCENVIEGTESYLEALEHATTTKPYTSGSNQPVAVFYSYYYLTHIHLPILQLTFVLLILLLHIYDGPSLRWDTSRYRAT